MALICPVCSVENRGGANFCKNCGSTLSSASPKIPPPPSPDEAGREWAATAPAQLRAPTIPAPLLDIGEPPPSRGLFGKAPAASRDDERTVIVMPGQASLPTMPPPSSSSSFHRERAERKRSKGPSPVESAEPPLRKRGLMLWLVLLAAAVVMVVAGWYGFGTRKTAKPVEAPPPVAAPPVAESPPAAPAAEPQTPAAEPVAQEVAPAAPVAAPKAAAAVKPRKPVAAAAPAAVPEAPTPAVAGAPPPSAPAAPAEPQALCGDRNFIAKAQCMASQCLKPEFSAHAQCEAVRRQQRLEEEKRNPTLLN